MHQSAIAAFMFLALAGCLGAPTDARAEDVGDWYFDPIEDADVILIGQAQEVHAGRVVNGCQYTAVTVQIEDVILGRLPSPSPGDLTVEFVGDCEEVGTLGGAVPKERAIWFLVNKGAWLRKYVLPKTGDWITEDPYWRPLEPDAIAVDHGGVLETHGTGPNWLGSGTFDDFVAQLRDSEYLRPNHDANRPPVELGFWFTAQAFLAAAGLFIVALMAALGTTIVSGTVKRVVRAVAGIALIGAGIAFVGGPGLARTVDFAGGSAGRNAVVESLRAGELKHLRFDDYALPVGLDHLALHRVVQAAPAPPTMVFFLTQVFFGPDPYCGYEYAQVPEALELDPLGSGAGLAEDLGDGWYWVCAR